MSYFSSLRLLRLFYVVMLRLYWYDLLCGIFFFQAEDGIRDLVRSRGLGDVYKRQILEMKRVSSNYIFLFLGPTLFWKYLDNPHHNAIVIKNPSTLEVLSLLSDGKILKVWGENVSYRLLQMPDYKLQFGPKLLQFIYKIEFVKILIIYILSLFEMVNLEQYICLIYSKKLAGSEPSPSEHNGT